MSSPLSPSVLTTLVLLGLVALVAFVWRTDSDRGTAVIGIVVIDVLLPLVLTS